ncbi:MAG TPA: hypothetical protein VFS07_04180 [Gemmatimonadales bacterium]|nr:hypothetical protein [Gemmatimonadales bacterium]
MTRYRIAAVAAAALALATLGCGGPSPRQEEAAAPAPDSTWIRVTGPTLIAFHPRVTDAELEADEALATALDDLAYHIGSAMDSLTAAGVTVRYQPGDSLKLLAPAPLVWVRDADSADVGYLFVDTLGHRAPLYGVRTNIELIELARAFVRTGGLTPWPIDLRRAGPVRYGMTLAEASQALGTPVQAGEELAAAGCSYTSPEGLPAGTAFMVLAGRIARLDVDTAGVPTTLGAMVGSTEAEVRALYGPALRTEPHPYDGPVGHYLIYEPDTPADSAYGMIFETDGTRVIRYRAGLREAVGYIEGCA